MSDSLSVTLGPLSLKNPITTASGTFGYGLEFTDFVNLAAIGGLCTKGLSLRPHAGNPPPRICETPSGMLNAIGLQNVGIAAVELNISCPNVRQGGMLFGNSPPLTRSLVAKVRAATTRPLVVKLSPN